MAHIFKLYHWQFYIGTQNLYRMAKRKYVKIYFKTLLPLERNGDLKTNASLVDIFKQFQSI